MHLGVEWPGRCRIAKPRDRFRMPPLPHERDPEVEGRVRLVGSTVEDDTERALGVGELLLLQMLPSIGEAGVGTRDRCRSLVTTGPARKRGFRDGKELSETHAPRNRIARAICCSARNVRGENDLTLFKPRARVPFGGQIAPTAERQRGQRSTQMHRHRLEACPHLASRHERELVGRPRRECGDQRRVIHLYRHAR
jgi:hypothetical protein